MSINGLGANYIGNGVSYYGISKNQVPQNGICTKETYANGMEFERTRPYTVTENNGLNKTKNSISLVPGVEIDMGGGYSLKIKENNVSPIHPNLPLTRELSLAAKGMDFLIRIANNQFTIDFKAQTREFYETKDMQTATIKALRAAGIDTERKFYINGTPFEVVKGEIRKIHNNMGEFLNERGMTPIAEKYEQQALRSNSAEFLMNDDEDRKA